MMEHDRKENGAQNTILIQLACKRHESYIAAARAIVHMHSGETPDEAPALENLWHILDLMAQEVNALGKILGRQMDDILEQGAREQPAG